MALNGSFLPQLQFQFSLNKFTDGLLLLYTADGFYFSHFEHRISDVCACSHRTGAHVYKPRQNKRHHNFWAVVPLTVSVKGPEISR